SLEFGSATSGENFYVECYVIAFQPEASLSQERYNALDIVCVVMRMHVMTADGMFDLFFTVTNQLPHVKRSMWCTTMWSLWKSQNLKLWDGVDEVVTTIYQCAATFLNQWQWANLKHTTTNATSSLPQPKLCAWPPNSQSKKAKLLVYSKQSNG
ncbi:hypothetical protein L195_g054126, partial [Trifolium pratense]